MPEGAAVPLTVDNVVERAERLAAHFRARLPDYDARAAFPRENFDEIREAGLHTMTVPEAHGGLGLWRAGGRFTPYYRVIETLARADSSTAQLLQVHCHATGMIATHGTDEQRAHYMSEVTHHGRLIASLGSEAILGAAEAVRRGELTRTSAGYRLNARKAFASLAEAADYFNVWVAIEGEGPWVYRMVVATVPRGTPGVELTNDWDTLGMRPTTSWSVTFTDVEVPAAWVIGAPGAWVRDDPRTFTLAFAANHVGTAQGALDFIRDYVAARPAQADRELIQARIGDLSSRLYAARSALYAASARWEQGEDDNAAEMDGMRALHVAKRVALDVTSEAYDICGARAAYNVYPLNQALRDVRAFTLHFSDDQYMAIVGRAELGRRFSAKVERYGVPSPEQREP
jgi:alkylation response protein AidB-like acyl-CoA dehydrogenase